MAAGLITQNVLCINTEIGVCQIELCVGDITKLPKEDQVDVLVISAFPGDYSPTPTSLVGQLKIQLGVSVRDLSRNKEEDLRRQYFCWWSKPLPDHLSFKRILCFEGGFGSRGTKPPKVIGAVFRCLVPVLNNREGSVIMPLLSSGDQGYSKKLVLKQVLNAAVHWMKAGLPLRTLKIVLFSRNPQRKDKEFEPLFELFQEFKAKTEERDELEKMEKEEDIPLYDIYISHCPTEHSMALQVEDFLQEKESKSLKIFHDVQELDENESWQDDIYTIMAKCSRIVTLLSPGYLASESCIEQYNIAMCISRRKHKEVLAPFYVISVECLPTYMGLMQYIDCRPHDIEKLKYASVEIKQWLESKNSVKVSEVKDITEQPPAEDYEVFISYSHHNKNEALEILKSLEIHDSTLNVFIDSSGLNTGASWQQSLYHAIDESKVMVALLSKEYLRSKVCKEEYSLAIALHMDDSRDFKLVSLLIEDIELPKWCEKPKAVDCASMAVDLRPNLFSRITRSIVISLQGVSEIALENRLAHLTDEQILIDEFTQRYRKIQLVTRKNLLGDSLAIPVNQTVVQPDKTHTSTLKSVATGNEVDCVLALSFSEEDANAAEAMKHLLLKQCPRLTISLPRTNATSRLSSLDVAKIIIIFLSPAYLNSEELVEELNIALYRHRATPHQVVYALQVSALPSKPSYIRLLPCDFAALDYSWMLRALGGQVNSEEIERFADENDVSPGVANCLVETSDLIIQKLLTKDEEEENFEVLLNALEVQEAWENMLEKLSKKEGMDVLKRSFGVQVIEKDSNEYEESIHIEHKDENEDKAKSNDGPTSPTDIEKSAPSQHHHSDKEKSVSSSRHSGTTKGSYDLTNPEKKSSSSCTVI